MGNKMKAIVFAIAVAALPLAVLSWPGGAPRCLYVPAGHKTNDQIPDFTRLTRADQSHYVFGVKEHKDGELKGMVEVMVATDRKYKGLLITTDFVTESTTA